MEKQRFSMLLLEPGEIYFEDYLVTLKDNTNHAGRLKICSKSLVFEPKSWLYPLIKIHYRDTNSMTIQDKSSNDYKDKKLAIKCKLYVEMLQENAIAPFKFFYETKEFLFEFEYSSAEACLIFLSQLQRASRLHAAEHNSMIATISHSRYMRTKFDPIMMDDFTEDILIDVCVERITPLVRNPGKIILTPTTLYYQPYNNIESTPVIKLKLVHMRRIYKRRFLQRQVGLEIYFDENSTQPHIYLSFSSEFERNFLYDALNESPYINLEQVHFEEMTVQWQNGVVSNYDYLLYLNCLADRSKNDLTQYPVFPWVISDYKSTSIDLNDAHIYRDLSKPMGALNSERLAKLKERYDEMAEPKFLYGSHYSAPGLVLFYLVRKYPHYMLCLQNGRFDHPDRMFNSVADVYKNCLNNMSDFKELIPEFYDTEQEGDIFLNSLEIDFGQRYDGTRVDHVQLPPWAESPKHFVETLRSALESEYVSRHLHLWIDLIFGYKQRGEKAVKANNLYHHMCYEGCVDLESVRDMNERHALEVQIMEFGQIPRQLFDKPHPRRILARIGSDLSLPVEIELLETLRMHKGAVSDMICRNGKIISVGKDGGLKVLCLKEKKQNRSVTLSSMPLTCCTAISDDVVAAGSCDNNIYVYDISFGRMLGNFRAHDDSITCLLWLQKDNLLVSAGNDCAIRVWSNVHEKSVDSSLRGLSAVLDHDSNVIGMYYREYCNNMISVTSEGEVYTWDLSRKILLNKTSSQCGNLNCFGMLQGDRIVVATRGNDLCVIDLASEHCIFQKRLAETINALVWDEQAILWLCGSNGTLFQWNIQTFTEISAMQTEQGSLTRICLDNNLIATAGMNNTVKLWTRINNCEETVEVNS